jgi:RNA polymerase sigma factor (sigma-70 family)
MATDVQLLDQFRRDRDDGSFRLLVVRHGPTVLRACRRILDDEHDVEDAFQATFLVLLRRAAEIHDPSAIEHWLHGVARRVALRAHRGRGRRTEHEGRRAAMQPTIAHRDPEPAEGRNGEVVQLVREEVGRLPGKYREAIELCDLDGCTHEEAAGRLGWPLGTLKTRLARGRRRLRDRLDRRGLALGSALLLWLLPRDVKAAELPESLVDSTVACLEAEAGRQPSALDPRYRRVRDLAAAALTPPPRAAWLAPLLLILVLEVAASAVTLAVARREDAERDAFAALPAGLTDVLNALCR